MLFAYSNIHMESVEPFSAAIDGSACDMASPVTGSSQEAHSHEVKTVTFATERNMADDLKKRSALDFAEQIRKLEIEGNKLRAATVSSLSNIGSGKKNGNML